MSPFVGRLYGLTVASDVALPGVAPAPGDPDVRIRRPADDDGSFAAARGEMDEARSWFTWTRLGDGSDLLSYRDAFEFLIAPDGRTITGHARRSIDPETYAVYLLNQALSFALLKLGREPIHATVVAVDGKAVALMGPSGAGKTTLASALVRSGGTLVTDDLLVVEWAAGQALAEPGPARLKLLPDTATRFFPDLPAEVRMNPDTHKRILPLPQDAAASEPVPLALLVVLRPPRPGRVALRALSPRRVMLDLVSNTFNPVVTRGDRLVSQFDQDARLAGTVPGVSLSAPRRWGAMDEVVERLRVRLRRSEVVADAPPPVA